MLAIDGFLRGLWVGLLAMVLWAVVAGVIEGLTGWSGMAPFSIWVFVGVGLIAAWWKVIKDSNRSKHD